MVIVIQCQDKVGLVASISQLLAQAQINIINMREYVDTRQQLFFARLQIEQGDAAAIQSKLKSLLPSQAFVKVDSLTEKKIAVLVSKEHHCLGDILIRNQFKTLGARVEVVIGNHPTLEDLCRRFDIPFFCVSHEEKSSEIFESEIRTILSKYQTDYIVLAKFMRILSSQLVEDFARKIINIHHSFLPAFVGAHPYRQAHERGVKLIGATAHFVTDVLDEGPIIHQQIIPINHTYNVDEMIRAGREIEKAVLAKALQWVMEDRVFVYQNKTVVFD